jgi:hypothetical protein
MSAVNTGNIAKALQVGVKAWWGMGYTEHPLELSDIFETIQSEKYYEEDVQLVGTGLFPQKAQGAPIAYDMIKQGFTKRYTQLTYAMGIIFTWEMLKYKQYELGFKQARYLGFSARQTQETIAANVLNRAFNSSYQGGDGKELLATDHPLQGGGTYRNELATPADLSHAALEQALIDIGRFVDERGNKIKVNAKTLIVPVDLMFEADRILGSTLESGTANNDKNTLSGKLKTSVNHYLTDADAWFIKTDVMDGLKRYVTEAVKAPVSENDFDTYNAKFKSMFAEAYGWTDPRTLFGSAGG